LHVLQPTLLDEGSKPLAASEIAGAGDNPTYRAGVRAIYPRLREKGRALRDEGVNFYDGSMAFATLREPVYYDSCHFGAAGNEVVAARIAESFLANMPSSKKMAREPSGH
jgi:lysophospholipase L1-like esterase